MRRDHLTHETVGEYPLAPVCPLKPIDSYLSDVGRDLSLSQRFVLKLWSKLTKVGSFLNKLNDEQYADHVLRNSDYRDAQLSLLEIGATSLFVDDPKHCNATSRAASLVISALDFYQRLLGGQLQQDTLKGAPLEMGQYANLFATSMAVEGDSTSVSKCSSSDYIVALCNGNFFKLNVFDGDKTKSFNELTSMFQQVTEVAASEDNQQVGVLSAVGRHFRSQCQQLIKKLPENERSLDVVRRALFVICIDTSSPENNKMAAKDIQRSNIGNRWYHASMQFVVFANGKAGAILNYRCYLDGNVQSRAMSEIVRNASKLEINSTGLIDEKARVEHLPVTLDCNEVQSIKAKTEKVLFNKESIFSISKDKLAGFYSNKYSQDALFNLALMHALYKMGHQKPVIAQAVAMTKYRCIGVTFPTISTNESWSFIQAISKPKPQTDIINSLLRAAVEKHRSLLSEWRSAMPFSFWWCLFYRNTTEFNKKMTRIAAALTQEAFFQKQPHIAVSKPSKHPEILYIGRPGVLYRGVGCCTLHYQFLADGIELIIAPSEGFKDDVSQFVEHITESLKEISTLLEE